MYVDPAVIKALALALGAAIAVIVALVTGILAKLGGANLANSTITGGAAFGGTMALVIAAMVSLGVL